MKDRVLRGPGVRRGLFASFRTYLANSAFSCMTKRPSGSSTTWIGLPAILYRSETAAAIPRILSSDLAPMTDPIILRSSGLPDTYSAASQSCCCRSAVFGGAVLVETWASIVSQLDFDITELERLGEANSSLHRQE